MVYQHSWDHFWIKKLHIAHLVVKSIPLQKLQCLSQMSPKDNDMNLHFEASKPCWVFVVIPWPGRASCQFWASSKSEKRGPTCCALFGFCFFTKIFQPPGEKKGQHLFPACGFWKNVRQNLWSFQLPVLNWPNPVDKTAHLKAKGKFLIKPNVFVQIPVWQRWKSLEAVRAAVISTDTCGFNSQ